MKNSTVCGIIVFVLGFIITYFLTSLIQFTDMGAGLICTSILYLAAVVGFFAIRIISIMKNSTYKHSNSEVQSNDKTKEILK